ncbi:MAG: hypothetical protein ILO68_05705, partial [Clostridia bacterium]|nr:hypothetical protein [Clostridia bacterium]
RIHRIDAKKTGIAKTLLAWAVEEVFCRDGRVHSKDRIGVSFRLDYIMKRCFPTGIKIGNDEVRNRVRAYLNYYFGEDAADMSDRALDAKISLTGVLCDRGKYIHKDYVHVDPKIMEEIGRQIKACDRNLVTYSELFQNNKELFEGTQITNRYFLQGALKLYGYGEGGARDFVRLSEDARFVDELDAFLKEKGTATSAEIFERFKNLTEASLSQVVHRSSQVFLLSRGVFIHGSQFHILPEDYPVFREMIQDMIKDGPVNIRKVYTVVSEKYPDFCERNGIRERCRLFAAFSYMFRDEFRFTRPYISVITDERMTNRSFLLAHFGDKTELNVRAVIDFCKQEQINYNSEVSLCSLLAPEYVRKDYETMIRRRKAGVTAAVVKETVAFMKKKMEGRDYIVLGRFEDFDGLPEIKVPWNGFVIQSILESDGSIPMLQLVLWSNDGPTGVLVSEKYADSDPGSFVLDVLYEELHKGTFTTKREMSEWMKEQGLMVRYLPQKIASAEHFYMDAEGLHSVLDRPKPENFERYRVGRRKKQ